MRAFNARRGATDEESSVRELESRSVSSGRTLWLTLDANPTLLLDERVLVFGKQYRLDAGRPDLLGLDRYGNVIVFEIKKGATGSGSAGEKTILSRPRAYARSIEGYGYDRLDGIFEEYQSGRWNHPTGNDEVETLSDAFERTFGRRLEEGAYNCHQRIVVVAERITGRTEATIRSLLERGLNVQCLEVQQFETGDGTRLLTTSTVVDYDAKRVRPDRSRTSTAPTAGRETADRVSHAPRDR
jgi:hypothetical protein